ncbi:MAG: mannose-6-phosphate isomerase [Gaiellaceae bacterium]|nr:mannose-6-phosphate isomerase [Gaiellaceae bacterium]
MQALFCACRITAVSAPRCIRLNEAPVSQLARVRPTRVYRFYRGGALIQRLRGLPERDDDQPEDWVGSVVAADNPGRDEPEAGLTRLEDGRLLREAIEQDRAHWGTPDLLVKLLDPVERLPVHAHPDREFARANLGSEYGKTEAWVVIATREAEAEVWLGLKESTDHKRYREWIEEQATDDLLDSLHRLAVRTGDVVFVPAGVPHAIGPGVLMVELQEPTDFSIICEWKGFPIQPADAHLGLGWDRAIEALHLDAFEPKLGLPDAARPFFHVDDRAEPAGQFGVLLVLEGEGEIDGERVRAGDAFVLPAGAAPFSVRGDLRVLRCLGPQNGGTT